MERIAVIIVAAGRGVRAGGGLPKQYRPMAGGCALTRSMRAFAAHPLITHIQPVIGAEDRSLFEAAARAIPRVMPPVEGGATRQDSVRAGLDALVTIDPSIVLIHDAARPFLTADLITRAIDAGRSQAAIPGLPVTDTIKSVDGRDQVAATIDRTPLRAVQTPQAFPFALIRDLHQRAAAAGRSDFTDDGALAEWAGLPVAVFRGERGNMKLTTDADFALASALDAARLSDIRVGSGFDVHAFGEGDAVMLGGIAVPHTHGLVGHSDADVVLHAATDAILGAIGDGDIGGHFPPSDPQWKGASSDRFLLHAVDLVRARGGLVSHLDVTVVCEAPRIGPHREAMRARIAAIAGLALDRVAVKATTSERLGFTGRREGIAAMATATVRLPEDIA